MDRNNLTAQQLRDVIQYDQKTGLFVWIKGRMTGKQAGIIGRHKYCRITIGDTTYLAHRLAWLYVYGKFPTHAIDHRDGNPTNNAIDNLRDVPSSINSQNIWAAKSNNACGLLGASWNKKSNSWHAAIRAGAVRKFIGSFKTAEEAHLAYMEAKIKLHGLP